ncbi:hypothetical protein ACFY3U_05340 [Micromonospora sp. NPDC000089]|uniref:hypothetical protein n=1 Tax=unclassified Micromonospora TaxID=2617518 RepID=UPI0036868BC7
MGARHRSRAGGVAAVAFLPLALLGCGIGGDDGQGGATAATPRAPAEEAAGKARERVQAYLDAMTAKDVDAGRSQLCAPMHEAFAAAATGPNGDFADHFEVSRTAITDVRTGPRGQEVSTSITVSVGAKDVVRPLLFTVTRGGADWCISGETPGGHRPSPTATP